MPQAGLLFVLLFVSALAAQEAPVGLYNCDPLTSEFDVDYSKPSTLSPVTLAGARNGTFSGKVVLASRQPISGVKASVTDFVRRAGGGKIAATSADRNVCAPVLVRYALHTMQPDAGSCFDALSETPPATSPVLEQRSFGRDWMASSPAMGWAASPVWVTVKVPADAPAGEYEATLTVSASGAQFRTLVRLRVSGFKLPDPHDFRTFAEIIESPDSVALQYGVPLWSDRHFKLLEASLNYVGQLGTKTAYIPLICETNLGNEQSMVRRVRQKDGSYKFDFTVLDRWLDLVEKCQGKPQIVCLYVWDAFLEGGTGKGGGGEEVLGHETKETQDERRAEEGRGVPVTGLDPASGKTERVLIPAYSDRAKSLAIWRPLAEELLKRMKKRGLEKSLVLGIVTDVQPAEPVVALFKEVFPGVPWMRRGHMRIKDVCGVPLALQEGPSYNTWAYDLKPGEHLYGWNGRKWQYPGLSVHFPRDLRDYYSRCRFRELGEVNIAGAQRGFGGLGADFWVVLKDKRGRAVGRVSEGRYPKSSWRNLNIETSLLAPGPEGAIATARFEMLREGVEECEARIVIEEALLDKKISGDLAKRAQDLLDDRIRALVDGMGKGWAYGGHWLTQKQEYPNFINGGWQERSSKLFDMAGEVGRK